MNVGALQALSLLVATSMAGCAGVMTTGAADAPASVAEKTSAPASVAEGSRLGGVDPTRFTPYFAGERGGAGAKALRERSFAEARAHFLRVAEELPPTSVLPLRARFVAAVCAHEAGDHGTALGELPLLVEQLPLLADHARYLAAISAYRESDFARSLELAGQVSLSSPLRPDADLLRGDALRALGRHVEVEETYRLYVHRRRGGRQAEATFKLAEAIERQLGVGAELDRVREAIRWYRRVSYRYPLTRWAADASGRIAALAERLGQEERAKATAYSADELLERAQSIARAHNHKQAITAFEDVLRETDPDGPIGCQARLGLGRAAYDGRQRERAAEALTEAAERCDETDVRAWSLYLAARANTARGDDQAAVELYDDLEQDHPGHSLADDARLRRAQAQLRIGKAEQFSTLLREVADVYPVGDMLCEAKWQLGWETYRQGELEAALAVFTEGEAFCRVPEEGAGGRERYWAGRCLEGLDRPLEATGAYEEVIRRNPLTFYMLLATERLEALAPERLRALLASLMVAPEGEGPSSGWRFDPQAIQQRPALIRGIELHRLGLGELARLEFAAASEIDGDEDLRWLSALLHHEVGDFTTSHWIARRELTAWRAHYPVGEQRRYWEVAFPQGFSALVREAAGSAAIPPELIWGVMREESGFNPTVESYAHAVGLLQLLPTTAARFAKGRRADRLGLKTPENNVPIAARYLSWLLGRSEQSLILAVASYNAGEGAVDRWRRQDHDLELDEALEAFTYDQTRRYTRRVLSSFGAYAFLYGGGELPRLLSGGTISLEGSGAPLSDAPAPAAAGAASSLSGQPSSVPESE